MTTGKSPSPRPPSRPSSKALEAWTELNDRQMGTLAVVYGLDQEVEQWRREAAASGEYDSRPASEWRAIDFAHDPSDRRLFGVTEMQMRLAGEGWDNQGNGATMAALADRGLITQRARPTACGRMLTVALTRTGRAAARAGLSLQPGAPRKAALSPRAWKVLALLWSADCNGRRLEWANSTTIERVLIGRHVPPLAARAGEGYGYEITQRGRDFYREHHAAHTAAHPDVRAPHPDGADAEPWPQRADEILAEHDRLHRALCEAWRAAHAAHQQAEGEASAGAPQIPEVLPAPVAEQIANRYALWCDTARQRADLAAAHAEDLHQRATRAARGYAAAALTVFNAAVADADPLTGLQAPAGDGDDWDEPRLVPPAQTGIHVIDAGADKLHAAAVGAPIKRRGPAPKRRRSRLASAAPALPDPGGRLVDLARFLHEHTMGGVLHRRLHPQG
ncbi:hypothetical protein AB0C84_35860 [Actinomadura sp. NPDC048955]|uniref:hypothetical protein n=1 Tax=Actinomadura sp. NPDC048955 TaxID=3158228 RepID=UPI0033EB6455